MVTLLLRNIGSLHQSIKVNIYVNSQIVLIYVAKRWSSGNNSNFVQGMRLFSVVGNNSMTTLVVSCDRVGFFIWNARLSFGTWKMKIKIQTAK